MTRSTARKVLAAAAFAAVVAGGAGIAVASGGDDSTEGPDTPITGDCLLYTSPSPRD